MIKNYLYLKNVEVSRSINFNFNRQSTDKLPTDYQQSADMLPTVGCLSTDRSLKPWKKLSADCWPTVGRLLANCRPTVGGGELFFTITLPSARMIWPTKMKLAEVLSVLFLWRSTLRIALPTLVIKKLPLR